MGIFKSVFVIALISSFVLFAINQSPASACTIYLGKKAKFDMELSPKVPLFRSEIDGCFYPGGPKVTKCLKVINVGHLPFRIYKLDATFYGDVHLATGLEIEILEVGKWRNQNLLYRGALSRLSRGLEVNGKTIILPGQSVTLQLTVWMPETAGNEYQGLSMGADISITVCFPICT